VTGVGDDTPPAGRSPPPHTARWRGSPGVRSHCRFRQRGTADHSESGMKWMGGCTKRQRDRAAGITTPDASRQSTETFRLKPPSAAPCMSENDVRLSLVHPLFYTKCGWN
jgi:hypothetical protein